MGILKDFKKFAVKGNVVIGLLLGNVDFKELAWTIKDGAPAVMNGDAVVTEAIAPVTINYGMFIQNVVDFVIIAFVIFMMVRAIVKAQKKEEAPPPPPPGPTKEETLLTEIRDLLKK